MIVERIYANNPLRNYHYLIACEETGEALAVDPLEWQLCLDAARQHGWQITQIVNTHEHLDHTGGNAGLVGATGATVMAHAGAASGIGGVSRGLRAGDVIKVGRSVELECLDTPGHTRTHVCLLAHADQPALFSGDTLFNAGVGNCKNGGDPELLFATCDRLLSRLSDSTVLHPGHDYLLNNLGFTLSLEADNAAAAALRARSDVHDPCKARSMTLGEEKAVNTFFRLQQPALIAGLRARVPALPAAPSRREVFLALRELRNSW
jgi:hydroxyacylglutathione hydrolase